MLSWLENIVNANAKPEWVTLKRALFVTAFLRLRLSEIKPLKRNDMKSVNNIHQQIINRATTNLRVLSSLKSFSFTMFSLENGNKFFSSTITALQDVLEAQPASRKIRIEVAKLLQLYKQAFAEFQQKVN